MWRRTVARVTVPPSGDHGQPPLEEVLTQVDQASQPAHEERPAHGSACSAASDNHLNNWPEDAGLVAQSGHATAASRNELTSRPATTIAPPSAESTPAEKRGPSWLVTIFDFLERQLSLASNVEERIDLLRAYALTMLAVLVVLLMAAVASLYLLANAHRTSLLILAASGAVTGAGALIRRRRR
jgi:hypothetical protein